MAADNGMQFSCFNPDIVPDVLDADPFLEREKVGDPCRIQLN